ncbi:MAG TPA: tRNA 2-thiocytidine biosynthesis TtcA family protein [Bacteroidales bacterium]|nr:tRNA 2-thiocytidine biosynthesis TtcA family protein [Bacteroidales bacterium]
MMEKLKKKVGRAIHAYNQIEQDDRVLAGISGGLDSLVMLEMLATRMKFIPIRYHLEAIHVHMEDMPEHTDLKGLDEFCKRLGIPLHILKTTTEWTGSKKKSTCFRCSWNRRKTIFQQASEKGFNKIALAHHMDDALETLLMNMTFHGEMSSIPPKISMFERRFDLIRPMLLSSDEEIKAYANHQNIQHLQGECPYEDKSKRENFREIVKEVSDMHRLAKINLFNAMGTINPDYLPSKPSGS